ncbi:MAG: undecaprenyldiphospho-muramoylpentapeptide beta-N-acetylglucosaminyltransferase [Marinifilaceae bacterium]|nr:undecaprenyldiphospho-muramoylpentapeptide beta-N-acetylglucosaminyltransferase [Marinifilaceae bacterium]
MGKRVIVCGGGTGGHIFPALSIANALKRKEKDIEILYVGALGRMEMEKVPEAGYRIIGLPVMGLRRKLTLENIKVLFNLLKSLRMARKIIKEFKPDVVVGVGGYASGPVGKMATKMGIPLLLQEQNSYAGVTNKLLGKRASKICVAYEGMERFFPAERIIMTGNPVRKDLLDALSKRDEAIAFYELDNSKKTILVTGGSLGAGTVNEAIKSGLKQIAEWNDVQLLWQCGGSYYEALKREIGDALPGNVKLMPFLKRMDYAYSAADLVVARAGASTISELSLLGKAAVLVPSPNVAEDHQTKNAMALVNKGAALMVKDFMAHETLCKVMGETLENEKLLLSLRCEIEKMAFKNSDEVIAGHVLDLIK